MFLSLRGCLAARKSGPVNQPATRIRDRVVRKATHIRSIRCQVDVIVNFDNIDEDFRLFSGSVVGGLSTDLDRLVQSLLCVPGNNGER